jgi:peroxiredoxin family protein
MAGAKLEVMSEPDINIAKIELPVATEDSARVIDAVADLFSPITEAMGTVGDHVRIFRTQSVLRTLRKTKRLAQEAGYKLKRPPLRFLVPFLEETSLQDDTEDPALVTMSANLLIQASQEQSQVNRMMIDLLARLTPKDAENLERIVRNPRYPKRSVNCIVDAAFEYDRSDLGGLLSRTVGKMSESDALETIVKDVEDRGVLVIDCGFYSIGEDDANVWDQHIFHPDFPDEDDLSLHSMAALGLLKFPLVAGRPYRGGRFSIITCVLTALGAEFYLNTHDAKLRDTASQMPPYERA